MMALSEVSVSSSCPVWLLYYLHFLPKVWLTGDWDLRHIFLHQLDDDYIILEQTQL